MKPLIDLVAGARPTFMKIGPLYKALKEMGRLEPRFVYTGQHTDRIMSKDIFSLVGLDVVDVSLGSCRDPGLPRFAAMVENYHDLLKAGPTPSVVVAVGDTDSALAACYVAKRHHIPVAHVEAGVRAYDDSPEETNRKMIDAVSELLLTPIMVARNNLVAEGCAVERLRIVGNLMIDGVSMITHSPGWNGIAHEIPDVLVTIHRPINVDSRNKLKDILEELDRISKFAKLCFPVHPRTMSQIRRQGFPIRDWMVPPLRYDVFLKTLSAAACVITDSGGVQAEAAYFKVPCLLLRKSTGWTNLVETGAVEIVSLRTLAWAVENKLRDNAPGLFMHDWDGQASYRIEGILSQFLGV